ncbi:MAG: pyruvate flavodoxin/ferredoxin oxidoreductase-like protein [Candidatus Peregrinibacteria bacterium Greene1014_49]|nr:MAG: pyruvate flavodoxin/ferredoxin oxidoreductase-like protein [Candidatus Peregrinibacteria bacterium Greene1014_49]
MTRISLKVTGAQGQGVNSVGEMCAKGLKRIGYCVFGYREYMSLIKGGHSSYQLDISSEWIESTETEVDMLVCFNHHGLERNACEVKKGGIILHQTPQWKFSKEQQKFLDDRGVRTVYLPSEDVLKKLKAKPILGNVLVTSVVWALLGRKAEELQELVQEQFGHKGEKVIEMNFKCIEEGFAFLETIDPSTSLPTGQAGSGGKLKMENCLLLPKPNADWKNHLLITGSEAMGLGLIHAGCRMYCGYPMTPSSPLLSYIAGMQNKTGMIIKQAEDEITAAQMMSGAMHMGTRAATGTSGGGFDLMTETPSVFILAQRPGPATGLPTWTAQGDLLLAIGSSHGEFARCVMAVADAQDCFDLMPEAFNIAERYQTPVIVMTDKQIAEALFTQAPYDQKKAKVDRGLLITNPKELKKLKSTDRYDPDAKDGISPRWLPGAEAATYCAQGDEHSPDGSVDETAKNAVEQMEKRMKKMKAIERETPEPMLWRVQNGKCKEEKADVELDLLVVSWGSNKGVILDTLKGHKGQGPKTGYLHYTYMWPMKTERLKKLMAKAKRTVLVECNHSGQLGMVIQMAGGPAITEKILKYDGRPFFVDELLSKLS